MKLPVATYRLQLREGLGFAEAAAYLPHLRTLGISHLYLSPIFTATEGSTHGYDVTRPDEIDPVLGGRDGFDVLSDAARDHGIGIILDIVPNHTAFSVENPWLADVLRHGPASRYARHFDINWDTGPLVLPWLPRPFAAMVAEGLVTRKGDRLEVDDLCIPLRPDADFDDPADLHAAQYWRLMHWRRERDRVTHRRFFNVTDLVGMRVEDEAVFDDMHRLIVELVAEDRVQGLRVDHVDGLADPAGYLHRLRAAVGDIPIWVEKILTGDETLPDWPVEGTTGYETGARIAAALSSAEGVARLQSAWRADTGRKGTFHDAVTQAKAEVLAEDLEAELVHLTELARGTLAGDGGEDPTEEALRDALRTLLIAFPRYRSYASSGPVPGDTGLWNEVRETAAADALDPVLTRRIARRIATPEDEADRALSRRFEQVTGALLAKSHEDTAGFRMTAYLAACEVGADPERPAMTVQDLARWSAAQNGGSLTLTSSHDAKRSEDARMRLVACSRHPEGFLSLVHTARALPEATHVPPATVWYLVQSALAIWDPTDASIYGRLRDHMTKALREAGEITRWTDPDADAEAAVHRLASALLAAWRDDEPAELRAICETGAWLSIAQLALKLALPGIPDIYRGCERAYFALTDPDNRLPVDLDALRRGYNGDGLGARKWRLLREGLAARRSDATLFRHGSIDIQIPGATVLEITRRHEDRSVTITVERDGSARVSVAEDAAAGRELHDETEG
ncbi:malto-oligosyltrehalose synthase [Rhodobacterales bacterium HKCCE2091]|nr:malto-oligosyltrehalose synthase [Rhodobacterales bacterium HKCCE2091]